MQSFIATVSIAIPLTLNRCLLFFWPSTQQFNEARQVPTDCHPHHQDSHGVNCSLVSSCEDLQVCKNKEKQIKEEKGTVNEMLLLLEV